VTTKPIVRVQCDDFDQAAEIRDLVASNHDIGAIATFIGLCRSEGESLSALELEHYPGMAESQMENCASAACERWPIDKMLVIHRYGVIQPGEQIVLVVAASRHRDAAFDGARYVMDFLKTDAPFWKKEHRSDGAAGQWVDARDSDETAKERWK